MTWVRANRFLAGLLAAFVIGAGALGFLAYSAYSRYSEVSQTYDERTTELKRLQALQPYPDEANRRRYEERRKEYAEAVVALQTRLAANSPVPEPIGATEFQSRLRDVVAAVIALARQNSVALPADFYLGFEQYRASVPPAPAAPLLALQLKDCDSIVRALINQRIETLTAFKRAPLPQESGAEAPPAAAAPPAPNSPAARAAGKATPAAPLVTSYPVEIEFRALPGPTRAVLDELVRAQPFYIIRAMRVKNEKDKGPARGGAADQNAAASPAAIPAAPPPPPARPGGPPAGGNLPEPPLPDRPTLRYVVGTERLETALRLELVRFSAPQ